ncbi:hypothetical protein B1R94_02390 [Mycolicibacterium litorale]|nr:hypothetical protein B1R94_02390 [Mycolicibacterium litorale]
MPSPVFEPPAGYLDMLGDAETGPFSDRWVDLAVPDVGVVVARRPRPAAIAWLAMSVNEDATPLERSEFSARFTQSHIGVGEWERLNTAMMDDGAPEDAIELVTRALATWGTARPHQTVLNLALNTAYLWRTIRLQFVLAGHRDPMDLPHMHIVLDATEKLLVESTTDEETRDALYGRLYPPPPAEVRVVNGKRKLAKPPPGFSPEEMAASWRAWTSAQTAG